MAHCMLVPPQCGCISILVKLFIRNYRFIIDCLGNDCLLVHCVARNQVYSALLPPRRNANFVVFYVLSHFLSHPA